MGPVRKELAARSIRLSRGEATGAVGDLVTVLPIIVVVAVLTELSLGVMLLWFGIFQVVWGVYYRAPVSVEPMKALAALIIAGSLTTGELLVAGVLLGVILLVIGSGSAIDRLDHLLGEPVVRGIQLGVAFVLFETGIDLGVADPALATLAVAIVIVVGLLGHLRFSAIIVIGVGSGIAMMTTGLPSPAIPTGIDVTLPSVDALTLPALEATLAQLAMTVGNACLATSVVLHDYFEVEASPDDLARSMGVMNVFAVPFGAFPMCHGSGGIAGKYAFGARSAGSNVLLGLGYLLLAVVGVGVVAAFPLAMLGIILIVIAGQLGITSIRKSSKLPIVLGIALLGALTNLGLALVVGVISYVAWNRWLERA